MGETIQKVPKKLKKKTCVPTPADYFLPKSPAKQWTGKSTWINYGFGFCLVLFGKHIKK